MSRHMISLHVWINVFLIVLRVLLISAKLETYAFINFNSFIFLISWKHKEHDKVTTNAPIPEQFNALQY